MKILKSVLPLLVVFASSIAAHAQVDVTMRGFTPDRNMWNSHETVLTQAKVATDGLRLTPQGPIPLFGDAHGTEGSPLIAHGVQTSKGVRNLLITANDADWVQAFDEMTGEEIWRTSLGTPVLSNPGIDSHSTNQHWGCLASGVLWKGQLYYDCVVSSDGSGNPNSGRYFFFVVNPSNGAIVSKVSSQDNNRLWKKRGSLVAATLSGRDTVCDSFGSIMETSDGYTGGLTCFDVVQKKIVLQWKNSAGHWNAGEGPVVRADQNRIYLMSGNGAFDPGKGWYGESFLFGTYKYDGKNPATFTIDNTKGVFSPWTDYQRSGQKDPYLTTPKLSGVNALSEAITAPAVNGAMTMPAMAGATVKTDMGADGQVSVKVYPDPVMAKGGNSDLDLGSGGYVYIASLNVVCGGGKDGMLYCLDADNFGGTTLVGLQDHQTNCRKLIGGTPVFATAYVAGVDPCTDMMASLNFLPLANNVGVTDHLHMTPAVMPSFSSPAAADIFVWGENFTLHEWEITRAAVPRYVAESVEIASVDVRSASPGGMTGGMVTGCSNGTDSSTYLLFATIPYGDANNPRNGTTSTAGRLIVYDPVNRDASGHIKKIWDSQQFGIQFAYNKFLPPMCADGHVFVATGDGRVLNLQ